MATCPSADTEGAGVDSDRLAYSTQRGDHWELSVATAPDDSEVLSDDVGTGATVWTPDAGQFAFATLSGEVFVQEAIPRAVPALVAAGRFPEWSPDGTQLAFYSDGDVHVICADGSHEVNLTDSPLYIDGQLDIAWSPDGHTIVFGSNRDGPAQLFAMDADGGHQRNLSRSNFEDSNAVWSPDGTQILFWSTRGGGSLAVMNADGGNQHVIVADPTAGSATWSPNGRQVLFATARDGNIEIYTATADGEDQTNLTNTEADEWFHPVWSPDGSRIAFVSSRDGSQDIYVMDANGARVTRWTSSPDREYGPLWIP